MTLKNLTDGRICLIIEYLAMVIIRRTGTTGSSYFFRAETIAPATAWFPEYGRFAPIQ